jgi:hypothetical protein
LFNLQRCKHWDNPKQHHHWNYLLRFRKHYAHNQGILLSNISVHTVLFFFPFGPLLLTVFA